MEKKVYQQPKLHIVKILHQCHLLQGTGSGSKTHTDDPQAPGNSMSRQNNPEDWDE